MTHITRIMQLKKISNFVFLFLLFTCFFISLNSYSQTPLPAEKQSQPIVLKNATLHIGDGKTIIENGSVRFENGKITSLGKSTSVSEENAKIVDLTGKHIYPSLILANNTLGLSEVDAVRASIDKAEVGDLNPNIRAISAYNTESDVTMTVRTNGVLIAQATPRGSLVAGLSSVVNLDAWNWEDASLKMDDGLHIYMPAYMQKGGWWAAPAEPKKAKEKERNAKIEKIKSLLSEAKAYNQIEKPTPKNLKLASIKGLFDGTMRLYLHAEWAKDIIEGVSFAKEIGVQKVVIVGGYDSWQVAEFLKKNQVPVIVGRTTELPQRTDDDIDAPFKLPYLLEKAGVEYCLNYAGGMETMGARNLPFSAGMAVAFGLTKEQALAAITSKVAFILGIDERVGTLEIGKDASIVVSEGDILDMTTNKVIHAFIEGREIDLNNKQKILYQKYKTRIENMKE
ncbi:amidohydrolase, imidazolonepropionase [Bernardetia litoralis DSM 6794]|uniref:Amidohydrolase, imidazolonepropionase n=1 Tax=Bernardetia litoralis (strain ATCC 23117 / DSM 6794 / NBRC 15988 / NCIMB 1366 / Fx l1 / Sio-4) TaxID=880071 RepID=I4AK91_BERLS|nr:amidohydrolase family protein [Bernardetia litoralis]AFM04376.1 amidohydrolase, imidazolonepropionase [Bernardetia litoralis DSM 6794]